MAYESMSKAFSLAEIFNDISRKYGLNLKASIGVADISVWPQSDCLV
jgi:hypothetical protein